jgi:hypothetical protein
VSPTGWVFGMKYGILRLNDAGKLVLHDKNILFGG